MASTKLVSIKKRFKICSSTPVRYHASTHSLPPALIKSYKAIVTSAYEWLGVLNKPGFADSATIGPDQVVAGHVKASELAPLRRHAVEAGSRIFIRAERPDIRIAQVIIEDDDKIASPQLCRFRQGQYQSKQRKSKSSQSLTSPSTPTDSKTA